MAVEKLTCPSCGASISKNQEKCRYCGSNVRVKLNDGEAEKRWIDITENLTEKVKQVKNSLIDDIESTQAMNDLPQTIGLTFGIIMLIGGLILALVGLFVVSQFSSFVGIVFAIIGLIIFVVGLVLCILVRRAKKEKNDL